MIVCPEMKTVLHLTEYPQLSLLTSTEVFPKTTVDVTSKDQNWTSSVKSVLILRQSPSNQAASVVSIGGGEGIWRKFFEFYIMKRALGSL